MIRITCAAACAIMVLGAQEPADHSAHSNQAPRRFSHELPQMDGSKLKVTVVEVTYAPGGSSAPHSHPCPVIGYVTQGSLRMQVKGEPEHVYKVGESFYEAPNGIHMVSANASETEPARFVVSFICDHETPLTVPPPQL